MKTRRGEEATNAHVLINLASIIIPTNKGVGQRVKRCFLIFINHELSYLQPETSSYTRVSVRIVRGRCVGRERIMDTYITYKVFSNAPIIDRHVCSRARPLLPRCI